jgi:hypothetical protein
MKVLGGSYKTAWFVEHRIRSAFCTTRPGRRPLQPGPNFVDRTYDADQVGRYHQLGLKYLNAYKAEESWRARQRDNPNAFRDTVLALLNAEPLSLDDLIARDSAVDGVRREGDARLTWA